MGNVSMLPVTWLSNTCGSRLSTAKRAFHSCFLAVFCCQSKALWVESARTLASTYNVGIARDAIKTHQAAVEAEVSKHEDLSTASWSTAELATLVERHPGAATPFPPDYIDKNYPGYRQAVSAHRQQQVRHQPQTLQKGVQKFLDEEDDNKSAAKAAAS